MYIYIYIQIALTGRRFEVIVEETDTVEMLKFKIEKIQNIPSYQQKLIFTGTLMEDKNLLIDYGITSDSLIQLVEKNELSTNLINY